MRNFTQYLATTAIAACSAFVANAQTTATAELQAESQKILITFEGVQMAIPGFGDGVITLNDVDVTSACDYVYDPVFFFCDKVTISYANYEPAVANDGVLPDGEYTVVFGPNSIELDFFLNTEPITATFTVGETVGITNVNRQQLTVGSYNLNGQRIDGSAQGIFISNGRKSIVR